MKYFSNIPKIFTLCLFALAVSWTGKASALGEYSSDFLKTYSMYKGTIESPKNGQNLIPGGEISFKGTVTFVDPDHNESVSKTKYNFWYTGCLVTHSLVLDRPTPAFSTAEGEYVFATEHADFQYDVSGQPTCTWDDTYQIPNVVKHSDGTPQDASKTDMAITYIIWSSCEYRYSSTTPTCSEHGFNVGSIGTFVNITLGGSCTDTVWGPDPGNHCLGVPFEQRSNCGAIRPATGTKQCGSLQVCPRGCGDAYQSDTPFSITNPLSLENGSEPTKWKRAYACYDSANSGKCIGKAVSNLSNWGYDTTLAKLPYFSNENGMSYALFYGLKNGSAPATATYHPSNIPDPVIAPFAIQVGNIPTLPGGILQICSSQCGASSNPLPNITLAKSETRPVYACYYPDLPMTNACVNGTPANGTRWNSANTGIATLTGTGGNQADATGINGGNTTGTAAYTPPTGPVPSPASLGIAVTACACNSSENNSHCSPYTNSCGANCPGTKSCGNDGNQWLWKEVQP